MRCWQLWQPWASLWCSPIKVHETRDWSTEHRGWMLVYATKKFVRDVCPMLKDILDDEFGPHWGLELPTGAIIGAVNVIACKPTLTLHSGFSAASADDYYCGDFSPGRFAFERSEWKRFKHPIPYKGAHRKFLDVPDDLVREALAA